MLPSRCDSVAPLGEGFGDRRFAVENHLGFFGAAPDLDPEAAPVGDGLVPAGFGWVENDRFNWLLDDFFNWGDGFNFGFNDGFDIGFDGFGNSRF
jgi:hypothetical protein